MTTVIDLLQELSLRADGAKRTAGQACVSGDDPARRLAARMFRRWAAAYVRIARNANMPLAAAREPNWLRGPDPVARPGRSRAADP